jgi:hypothetical protein
MDAFTIDGTIAINLEEKKYSNDLENGTVQSLLKERTHCSDAVWATGRLVNIAQFTIL